MPFELMINDTNEPLPDHTALANIELCDTLQALFPEPRYSIEDFGEEIQVYDQLVVDDDGDPGAIVVCYMDEG